MQYGGEKSSEALVRFWPFTLIHFILSHYSVSVGNIGCEFVQGVLARELEQCHVYSRLQVTHFKWSQKMRMFPWLL